MMRRVRYAWVVVLMIGVAPEAWAGAWTVPKGHTFLEYFYRVFQSKKRFDQDGNSGRKPAVGIFRDIRNEWKLEYGLTDWWNLLASVPYQSAHSRDETSDLLNSNVGDIFVRTKLRFLHQSILTDKSPLVGSAQFSWKIPSAYDPRESPGLGDGQVDFESRLLLSQGWAFSPYEVRKPVRRSTARSAALTPREAAIQEAIRAAGHSPVSRDAAIQQAVQEAAWLMFHEAEAAAEELAPTPVPTETEVRHARVAFVNLEGGFTARNEEPANEFPMVFEAGFTPLKRLMLVGRLDSVVSVNSTNEDIENWLKWDVRAVLNVWGDGFSAVFRESVGPTVNVEVGYTDLVAGRNTEDAFELYGKINVFF